MSKISDIRNYLTKSGSAKPAATKPAADPKPPSQKPKESPTKPKASPAKPKQSPASKSKDLPSNVRAPPSKQATSGKGCASGRSPKPKAGPRKAAVVIDSSDDDDDFVAAKPAASKAAAAKRKALEDSEDEYVPQHDKSAAAGGTNDDDVMLVDSDSDDDKRVPAAVGAAAGAGGGKGKTPPSVGQGKRGREAEGAEPVKKARAMPASIAASKVATPPAAASGAPGADRPSAGSGGKQGAGAAAAAGGSAGKRGGKAAAAAGGGGAPLLDESGRKAVAAVDEAVQKLPAEGNWAMVAEGEDAAGNDAEEPPLRGQKDVPRGHPDCLTGRTFVITGILDSLYRHEAEDIIKRHGGRVTSAVSGKTSFLVAGQRCGRSKLAAAQAKGTKVVDEDGLFSLIAASAAMAPAPAPAGAPAPSMAATPGAAAGSAAPRAPVPSTLALGPGSFFGAGGSSGSAAAGGSGASAAARTAAPPRADASSGQLWVDKHKPRGLNELVGNNTLVTTLRAWLQQWPDIHLRGAEPRPFPGQGQGKKDLQKKAVLLSGSPGIGKTSAAHIVARECGYAVVEMNASDTRNKADAKIKEGIAGKAANMIKEMVGNENILGMFGKPSGGGGAHRQVLIMDEVDGMSGGDRGGVQDLIDNIKRAKIPIICICNDKWHQKLRSLRNYCLELDFKRPTALQIGKRLQDVCAAEGLHVNQATMNALVEGACGDLRLILGQLQMVRLSRNTLNYDDVKGRQGANKDADLSPFDCSRRLFEPVTANLSMNDRLDMVFADSDLVPLLVQENYVNYRPIIAGNDEQRMRALAKAADAISAGDVLNSALRRTNNWSLGPAAMVQTSLVPTTYMRGGREALFPHEMNFPRFTAWLGNFSSSNKQRRLLGELTTTMGASGSVPSHRTVVRTEYLPAMRRLLPAPLAHADESGEPMAAIATVVSLMDEYGIGRDQFDYILDVTNFKTKAAWGEDPMKDVPTKVKSAFTRAFNATSHAVRCSLQLEDPKKGRAKKKVVGPALEDLELGALEEGEDVQANDADSAQNDEEEDGEPGFDPADAEAMKRKLARRGLDLQVKQVGKGKKAEGGRGGGSGSGSGSGGATSGRGGGHGRGRGRGRGK